MYNVNIYQTRHKHREPLAWRLTRPEEEDSTGNNITPSGDVEQMKKDKNGVFCVLGEVRPSNLAELRQLPKRYSVKGKYSVTVGYLAWYSTCMLMNTCTLDDYEI